MKKSILFMSLLSLMAVSSCSKNEEAEILKQQQEEKKENTLQLMYDDGSCFFVEIDKKESELKTYYYKTTVPRSVARDVTVEAVGHSNEWNTAIAEAIEEWNAIPGCIINFRQVSSGGKLKIPPHHYESPNASMKIHYPATGNIEDVNVWLNSNPDFSLSAEKRKHRVMVLLGSALGFAIEGYKDESTHISGTSTNFEADGENSLFTNGFIPSYRHGVFSCDDIKGITAIYGCEDKSVSAAVKTDAWGDAYYFFNGNDYSKYDMSTSIIKKGYPKPVQGHWYGSGMLTQGIDAAIDYGNGHLYFFKDDEYVKYSKANDVVVSGYPRKIQNGWDGVPDNLDAAANFGDGYVYFFKGDKYYKYSIAQTKVISGYPKSISLNWYKVPSDLDAVLYSNGFIFFFKGDQYWVARPDGFVYEKSTINHVTWPGLGFD